MQTHLAFYVVSALPKLFLAASLIVSASASTLEDDTRYRNIDEAPHFYKTRAPKDRFSRIMKTLETDPRLDRSSEKAFLTSFLKILEVPASSQMLVFSTTSLQLRFISPSNPRAIFFNDEIYVGYIPGGRLEIIGTDPDLGAVFYIFDIPKAAGPIHFERSDRCMNCHAGEETGYIPGLIIKSSVPGPGGGSLEAFRINQMGHQVPLTERFGGWHVTGKSNLSNHWGNLIGRLTGGVLQKIPNPPGAKFDLNRYPVSTSDILAHLLHEHQVGFFNRAVEAAYRVRTAQFVGAENSPALERLLDKQAEILVKYILFADETALPPGGIEPDPAFYNDFQSSSRVARDGAFLKQLNLKTRLFERRCSYMIYSPTFDGLPSILKNKIFQRLKNALAIDAADPDFAYLPNSEKGAIRQILKETLPNLPASW